MRVSNTEARKIALDVMDKATEARNQVDCEVDAVYDPPWQAMNIFAFSWMSATHWQRGENGQQYMLVDKDTAKTLLEWFQVVSNKQT